MNAEEAREMQRLRDEIEELKQKVRDWRVVAAWATPEGQEQLAQIRQEAAQRLGTK